jgi:hypothetical protein
VTTCEVTLGLGRITTGNGQVVPAVPRVALREAEPAIPPARLMGAHNAQNWTASIVIGIAPKSRLI